LPRTIEFDDIDIGLFEFLNTKKLDLIVEGKKVELFYLENERWGEFSKTWKFMDGDKNVPTPYITVRRFDKEKGTRLGDKFNVPQGRSFRYLDVPVHDEGQDVNLRFKIPEPTNVDLIHEVRLFTKLRVDVNDYDRIILNAFKSKQAYIFVKGHPMPLLLESIEEGNTIENVDGDRYYVSIYKFRSQAFILNDKDFEITNTTRIPRVGVDLS
jgi:hypothetical protein